MPFELTIISIVMSAACIIHVLMKLSDRFFGFRPATLPDYIYKIARVTGTSEYEVFCKSAEHWQVGREAIERDFHAYLAQQAVPYYVTDFIRRNKAQIDGLRTPRVYY